MLILGERNDDSLARDFDWFGSSERLEISPASIWVPDEDETIRQRRVKAHLPPIVEEDFDDYWSLHQSSPPVTVHDEDLFAKPRALPEINPQISVRDEDSFAKPRPLPEINPHVSVRDEDSFAKPSPLPEINPHVSVRDEDSFAKPSPLPEINPHVSVRDEDSFAKPRALPEINPHVSVRDEDSFAKPSALPEINPHISVSDEDSFAKPSALPEIRPQISILDKLEACAGKTFSSDVCEQPLDSDIVQETFVDSSPQFTSGVCGMEESKVQPGEPSFVTVNMDGQNEKRFVREYMELGPSHPIELESNRAIELGSSRQAELGSSRPTELESSHPAELESSRPAEFESSHPAELEASRPAEFESSRPIKFESSRPAVSTRVRVLDESQVLPGEASFATAIPGDQFASQTHSSLEEFLAKTNLDLRTLGLATLLFVSIIGVSALVILEVTSGIFSSHLASATANHASQTAESAVAQSEALPTTNPVTSVAVPKLTKQESQSMAPPREYSKFPKEVTKPMSLEGSISDSSRKANSNDVRIEKSDRQSARKSTSGETSNREGNKHSASSKNLRANLKESGARKKVGESVSRHSASSLKRPPVNRSNSKTTAGKPASVSAKNATIPKPKTETKVPSASNGAQRPRTVTPRRTS